MIQDSRSKTIKTGVFIDDANLYFAAKKAGWKLDLHKLKEILRKETNITLYQYYIATPAKWDVNHKHTLSYIDKIKDYATIKTKAVKYIRTGNTLAKKGDVDVEIVLDVVRNLPGLDLVIIVSGDSDYIELRKYVLENKKQIVFLGYKHNMAWELKKGKYLLLDKLREYIEMDKKTPRSYPGRILLNILYQKGPKKSMPEKFI